MEFRAEKLRDLLKKITTNRISIRDLNLFIAYCQALSKTTLIHQIQNGRLNLDQSLTSQFQLDDFALDCIADLFARNDRGEYFLIKRAFALRMDEIEESAQAAPVILRKLIASRVHQSLISLFSSVDQGGWKILRNLTLVPKRHPHIHEFSYLSNTFFFYSEIKQEQDVPGCLNPNGLEVSDEVLSDWLQTNLKEHYGMPQTIAGVFQNLSENSEYRQFLERGRLYHTLKTHLNLTYSDMGEMESLGGGVAIGLTNEVSVSPNELIHNVHQHLTTEIISTYVTKGKINSDLGRKYSKILELYFSDLISDGFVEKLQQYLSLTENQDLMNGEWLLHRGRLEYMIKLGKSWLQEQLKADEIPTKSDMRLLD